jgi:predicted O-methyltransferase YrrM
MRNDDLRLELERLKPLIAASTENVYRQTEAFLSLITWIRPRIPLPALRGWAMSPDSLLPLVLTVVEARPRHVVELGSGASTVVLAYALRKSGKGKLVSFEHDSRFAAITNKLVHDHRLTGVARVVEAPLAGEGPWYDRAIVARNAPAKIDLLVVDGPPAGPGDEVRYPAAPCLLPRLSENGLIVMDDAARDGERAVLARWERDFALESRLIPTEKGLAVLRRRPE